MYQTTFTAAATQVAPATVAFMNMRGPYEQMAQGYQTLYAWIGEHGLVPAGPPIGVYLTDPSTTPIDQSEWEIWAPIAGGAESQPSPGEVGVKSIPEMTVAYTTYVGPYDKMQPTYTDLMAWIADHGYEIAGPSQEVYLSDPNSVGPEQYVTEVRFPIKPR